MATPTAITTGVASLPPAEAMVKPSMVSINPMVEKASPARAPNIAPVARFIGRTYLQAHPNYEQIVSARGCSS